MIDTIRKFLLIGSFLLSGTGALAADYYVATNGSDSNAGTLDQPFATMKRARDEIRRLRQSGSASDVNVYFRQGTYRIYETVVFGLQDGSDAYRTTYQAFPGERAVFSSGFALTGWRKTDEAPSGLPEHAEGNVWEMDLAAQLGCFKVMYDGEKLLLRARSKGFNSTKKEEYESAERVFQSPEVKSVVYFPKGRIKNWKNLKDIELLVYPSIGWTMNILSLESVDEVRGTARTTIPATYPMRYIKGKGDEVIPEAMFVENCIECLDRPGDWVVDTRARKIWYWPESGQPGGDVVVPLLKELVRVEGRIDVHGPVDVPVRNVHFKGLTFIHGERDTWMDGDCGVQHDWEMADKATAMLRFRGAQDCSVEECRFASSGGTGLRLDLHCQNISVTKCLFEDLGISGVLLCGYGPGAKNVSKNNIISNNRFTRTGQIYWHGQALLGFQTGGNLISHNTFIDLPRKAIGMAGVRTKFFNKDVLCLRECASTIRENEIDWPSLEGKDLIEMYDSVERYYHTRNNIIEYNHCENVLARGSDGAAINFTAAGRGNIIRHNFVYNLRNPQTSGIRLDGHVRGTQIYNNILYNGRGFKPKPPENETFNNIFVSTEYSSPLQKKEQCLMFEGDVRGRIERNVFYYRKDFMLPVDRANVTENPAIKLDGNLYYCEQMQEQARMMLQEFRAIGYESKGIFADPLFRDIDNLDFRLRQDSPLKALGFQEITLDGIGVKEDFPRRFDPP